MADAALEKKSAELRPPPKMTMSAAESEAESLKELALVRRNLPDGFTLDDGDWEDDMVTLSFEGAGEVVSVTYPGWCLIVALCAEIERVHLIQHMKQESQT